MRVRLALDGKVWHKKNGTDLNNELHRSLKLYCYLSWFLYLRTLGFYFFFLSGIDP